MLVIMLVINVAFNNVKALGMDSAADEIQRMVALPFSVALIITRKHTNLFLKGKSIAIIVPFMEKGTPRQHITILLD